MFSTVETYAGGQPIVTDAAVRLAEWFVEYAPEGRRGRLLPVMERLRASVVVPNAA
ncbi:hypothetical protein [Curtobacterium sp. RRHDQ10]|uniref:hypothetical protein n=1 Tax=Curtobacterium phyllosphaerae TaxID=3413379 RepID=UPI003BF340B9